MQAEIIEFLQTQIRPLGVSEIANAMKKDKVNVSRALKRLMKFNEVGAIEIDRFEARKRFNAKRRMRLYYLEREIFLYITFVIFLLQILQVQ